jgi:hypothetical protein
MDTSTGEVLELDIGTKSTPEESIAQSIIPYNRDDDRARYLGLRASGFTIREALRLIGKAHSTLSFWRQDPEFKELEERLPEFKKELALEYANLEFLRNYRLILEKDFRVIKKSLDNEAELTPQEHSYLLKLRSHYTPQQLQIIESLLGSESQSDGFDFTEKVLELSRTVERVRVETRNRSGAAQLGKISDGEARLPQLRETND